MWGFEGIRARYNAKATIFSRGIGVCRLVISCNSKRPAGRAWRLATLVCHFHCPKPHLGFQLIFTFIVSIVRLHLQYMYLTSLSLYAFCVKFFSSLYFCKLHWTDVGLYPSDCKQKVLKDMDLSYHLLRPPGIWCSDSWKSHGQNAMDHVVVWKR